MRLTRLYVRFFRSFNFDYERKADPKAKPLPWEQVDDGWFPFIRIDLDGAVTAVVGANESGKSHLIAAIKQALTGEGISRSDFCRYSSLFSVETGKERRPDLGIEFELDRQDVGALEEWPVVAKAGDRLTLMRFGDGQNALIDKMGGLHEITSKKDLSELQRHLPMPFELATYVALPDSVSLVDLIGGQRPILSDRRRVHDLVAFFQSLDTVTPEVVTSNAPQIAQYLNPATARDDESPVISPAQLGRSLLLEVAKIDVSAVQALQSALYAGKEGEVGGLVEQMNRSLSRHLNFTRWWRQDPDFQLRVSPRERELVFTIRDRTGTDYSFAERSRGLTYFLSYYVQLRAHQQSQTGPEVLLMDEPDAYLSSAGQQDLLRALEDFATPEDGTRADQVVYVTHSPFLINKNAAHRIRVLDKGSNEEGTRVVRDVARNHYEPLRSSVGSFVAETAFIGGANLLVEGVADQVLLSGLSSTLRRRGGAPRHLLDLNEVTIVPAGSASGVPYMAYLARGRDEVKPACIALLDGDQEGRAAARRLVRRTDGNSKRILEERFVVDIAAWADGAGVRVAAGVTAVEIEDLVPVPVAVEAARSYAKRMLGSSEEDTRRLTSEAILQKLPESAEGRVWKATRQAFADAFDDAHIDKVGFAKEIVGFADHALALPQRPNGVPDLEHNFGSLIAELAQRLNRAVIEESELRTSRRTDRIVRAFLRDHPAGASRDAADQVLRDVEVNLEDDAGDEAVRSEVSAMRRQFHLASDPLTPVAGFGEFCERLKALKAKRRLGFREAATSSAASASW
jgi:energy-coupling factor transporter ATP-binding protein EcfA2